VPQLFCHLVTVHEAETEFFSRLLGGVARSPDRGRSYNSYTDAHWPTYVRSSGRDPRSHHHQAVVAWTACERRFSVKGLGHRKYRPARVLSIVSHSFSPALLKTARACWIAAGSARCLPHDCNSVIPFRGEIWWIAPRGFSRSRLSDLVPE